MKNLLSLLLILGCFGIAQANNIETTDFTAKTKLVKEDVINVQLVNLQGHFTKLTLTNLEGDVEHYSQWMESRNGWNGNLNIGDLKNGKYLLTVKSNGETLKQVLKIKNGMILFSHFS